MQGYLAVRTRERGVLAWDNGRVLEDVTGCDR